MPNILLDNNFEPIGRAALDSKKRIALSKAVQLLRRVFGEQITEVHFSIALNEAGQILLSPETSIPLHEAWLFRNEAALSSVRRGMEQAKLGELEEVGSFAEFADDEGPG